MAKKQSLGPIDNVACPWCKRQLDFSDVDQQLAGGEFGGSSVGQNIGARGINSKEKPKTTCDYCGRDCVITGIFHTPIITMEGNGKRGQFWLNNVKCPFCSKHQDLSDVYRQQAGYEGSWEGLAGEMSDGSTLEDPMIGAKMECDHCHNHTTIKAIHKTPFIRLARK